MVIFTTSLASQPMRLCVEMFSLAMMSGDPRHCLVIVSVRGHAHRD